jgi:serine protease Do
MRIFKVFLLAAIAALAISFPARANTAIGELTVEDIVKKNSDSIVLIGAIGPKGSNFGSGFIITSNGLIVTNFHIVQAAVKIAVKLKNNKTYNDVRLINFDQKKDIAVLKIDAVGLKPVVLGDSHSVQAGERVVAIGSPLGLESTVADGLVSSLRKADRGFQVLQITVPISPGSSGSPLFNLRGEVIGIAVGTIIGGQNINFAIPINYATPLIPAHNAWYVVQPGDTLFALARKLTTTVKALMESNKLADTKIFAGQRLRIPHPE